MFWRWLSVGGASFNSALYSVCHLLVSFLSRAGCHFWRFPAGGGEKRKIPSVRRTTWDGEIEFKLPADKRCTAETRARGDGRRQNSPRKQTCYQGLERRAEPFSAAATDAQRQERLWMARTSGRPVMDESL